MHVDIREWQSLWKMFVMLVKPTKEVEDMEYQKSETWRWWRCPAAERFRKRRKEGSQYEYQPALAWNYRNLIFQTEQTF